MSLRSTRIWSILRVNVRRQRIQRLSHVLLLIRRQNCASRTCHTRRRMGVRIRIRISRVSREHATLGMNMFKWHVDR
jgi:hypothetical protein